LAISLRFLGLAIRRAACDNSACIVKAHKTPGPGMKRRTFLLCAAATLKKAGFEAQ
jgi:hypothetical protein